MPPTEYPPLVEAFLLIEQPRQRLGHWTAALAALDSPMAPAVAAIVAYYDPTCDQALINLRYDELALGSLKLGFVVEIAQLAEVGLIQPDALSELERKRFLSERLARCTLSVQYQRSAVGALCELVRRIKEQRSAKPPPVPVAANGAVGPRGDTQDPVLLVAARGTRDDLVQSKAPKLARATRDLAEQPACDEIIAATSRHVIARTTTRQRTAEMAPAEITRLALDTRGAEAHVDGARPVAWQARAHKELDTDAYLPTASAQQRPGMIYARYLRSGRWVPIRIGALSLKGASLLAGALPRLQDHVDIALAYGAHRALVRGAVSKVSSVRETSTSGASTFSVKFELDEAARRQLTELLTAARRANVTIKPPPPRSTRRFPVEWPMCLGTPRGLIKADALDVSTSGMFVRPAFPIAIDSTLSFSAVLDDAAAPICGTVRVVRQIDESEASTCGLAPGYGLALVEISEPDRLRWLGFLARIERRAGKRVLIGASPARLAELQAGLAAAGYAVTGGADPGALVQLANADARPVDAALIDAGWLQSGASASWVESLFSARNVPCVTIHGEVSRARMMIDRLLEVIV